MLPIYSIKQKFIKAYNNHDCVVVKATAGSGKSTQLPQYLLECCEGRILVTEPRAIAAESVAKRVQEEISKSKAPKGTIGYIVGPNLHINSNTRVVYMTEHEFLNQLITSGHQFLNCFEAFVIDEVHELTKTTLIMIAVIKNAILRRGALIEGGGSERDIDALFGLKKMVITSATLDLKSMEEYLGDVEIESLHIEAPTYGVEIKHAEMDNGDRSLNENTVYYLKQIFNVSSNLEFWCLELNC